MKAGKSKIFYGWWVALGLFFVSFFGNIGRFIVSALGPTMARDTGWTTTQIMLAVTVSLFSYSIAGVFVGRLVDTAGGRKVITVGGILLTVGFFLLSRVSDLWQLYLAYGILQGVAISTTQTIPDQSIARKWFIKQAGMVCGFLAIAFSVSQAIMFPVIGQGGASIGWRDTALLSMVFGGGVVLIGRLIIRDTPESIGLRPYGMGESTGGGPQTAGTVFQEQPSIPVRQAIRTLPFWGLCLAFWPFGMVIFGFTGNIAFWGESVGANPASVGLLMTAWGFAAMFAKPVWGLLGDKLGKRKAAIIGSAACVAVFLGGWAWVKDVTSLYVFVVVYGLVYSYFVLTVPYLGDLFGRGSIGALTGFVVSGNNLLGALGPILWSRIYETTGTYNLACLVSAGIHVVVLVGYVLARPLTARS